MSISRRDFLRTSAATAAGLAAGPARAGGGRDANCIFLLLSGGPSQLDTWDPKPDAPGTIRGPFQSIATRVPGLRFTELFPRMAAAADRFAVVRSMHHTAAPIHETGMQLLQTGALAVNGRGPAHLGAVVSATRGRRGNQPANVLIPGPLGFFGVRVGHGQTVGEFGDEHGPSVCDAASTTDPGCERYGGTEFGASCLTACDLVERGARFVTVNMFETVYDAVTWDCHAAGGSLRSTLSDYRQIGPAFDTAYTALLGDLHQRGLLENTLVVATGELGRTPYLNREGGRDHWAGCWSLLLAGAGVMGGTAIGSSDRLGGEPADTAIGPDQLVGTMRHVLGLPGPTPTIPGLFG